MTLQINSTNREQEPFGHGIIGTSPALTSVLRQIGVAAPTDATVLIQGETGTGKELIARAIHSLSPRRNAPLVTLNCAAIPAGLIESELFGHERGAFTGALMQRIGRFEMAHGGTLFLDEIGDLALDLQVKILRVIQEQEFERLGGARTIRANVRLVAATHRCLHQMVKEKSFRADLYYRLSVFPVSLPPLRDRPEDIPALVRYFLRKYSERLTKIVDEVTPETLDALAAYEWPGNIRQLQNFVEHGVIISGGRIFQPALNRLVSDTRGLPRSRKTLDEAARAHILQTLEETKGVIGGKQGAAARLGVARTTLLSKMRRLGIESSGKGARDEMRQHAFAATA